MNPPTKGAEQETVKGGTASTDWQRGIELLETIFIYVCAGGRSKEGGATWEVRAHGGDYAYDVGTVSTITRETT